MTRPPRNPSEPVIATRHWASISGYGLLISLSVLGVFEVSLNKWPTDTERAVTLSFLALAFAQLWHVFNMRGPGSAIASNEVTRNPYVWGALALCTLLLLAGLYVPGMAKLLKTRDPGLEGWVMVGVGSCLPLLVGQIGLRLTPRDGRGS
jgi:Ca2+-transporting ATPase